MLSKARSRINLTDIGITDVKIRFTVAGSILIEIPGDDRATKADNLMRKLREIFPENGEVRITRPIKRTNVRISGLDVSVRKAEVIEAVVNVGDCLEEDIKIGEIKQCTLRGSGVVWIQCPTEAAKRLVDQGKITVAWVAARVEALKPRPLACFKCMEKGQKTVEQVKTEATYATTAAKTVTGQRTAQPLRDV